jgi:hypothetical protein
MFINVYLLRFKKHVWTFLSKAALKKYRWRHHQRYPEAANQGSGGISAGLFKVLHL